MIKMLHDPLAQALSAVMNNEKAGKKELIIYPANKLIRKVLLVLNKKLYVGTGEEIKTLPGGAIKLSLIGNINAIGVIKPRFAVTLDTYEKFEKRFLPAQGMGILIVSTNKGLLTHYEAKKEKLGGKLIAYCY